MTRRYTSFGLPVFLILLITGGQAASAEKQKRPVSPVADAEKPKAARPAGPSLGDDYALLDAPGRKPVPLKVAKSLDYLKNALRFDRIRKPRRGDIKAGMLEFTVRRGGPVFLAVNWEYDGSKAGNWAKERMTHNDMIKAGWLEVERCPWDTKQLLYYRVCKTGEKFRIRNRRFGAPDVLVAPPVDFSQKKYLNRIPVRSVTRLLNRRNLRLLEEKKYDELEKIAGPLRKNKTKFRNGDSMLFEFYNGLSNADTELERSVTDADWQKRLRQIEAWQKAKPKSITPRIALAMCYDSYGSFARGHGWASTVSDKNMQLFHQRNEKARAILLKAEKEIAERDPAMYSTLLATAIGLGVPRPTFKLWVSKAVEIDPTYMPTFYAATLFLLPRWHGFPGELEKFAEEMAEKTKKECGLMVYTAIVRKTSWYHTRKTFEDFEFSWEKTRRGFRDFEKKYPGARDHYDRFCYLACLSGDRKTAQQQFQRIGDGYRINQWGYQNRYRRWQAAFQPEIEQGEQRKFITAHEDGVLALDYSHDGEVIVTGGLDEHIRLWNAKTGKKVASMQPGDSWASCLDFSLKSPMLVIGTGDGDVLLWDFANRRAGRLGSHKKYVQSVVFSADGKLVASIGLDNVLKVWDVESGDLQLSIEQAHKRGVKGVCFHPDGKLLATVGFEGQVILRDTKSGKVASQWTIEKANLMAVTISPDGKRLAAGDTIGVVSIWDIKTKKLLAKTPTQRQWVQSLAFSPKGDLLAIAIGLKRHMIKGGAFLWKGTRDAKPIRLKGQTTAVTSIRFSPSGETIATGSMDWSLRLWRTP